MTSTGARLLTAGPRLYRAARRGGASPGDAAGVLRVSLVALVTAAAGSPRRPGRRNARRHFSWQACLTARYGAGVARAVGDEHERGSTRPADSAVDRHNNEVGRRYGAEHADALRGMPVRAAVAHLCAVADALWESGELRVVEPR